MSAVIIILAGVAWISIGWWNDNSNQTEDDNSNSRTVSGQNDAPPNYDRAIRGNFSINQSLFIVLVIYPSVKFLIVT